MAYKKTGRPNGNKVKVILPTVLQDHHKGNLPQKEINFDQVLHWMELQATAEEIAGSFRVSTETLDTKLHEVFGMGFLALKKRTGGKCKMAVRRYQFQQAEKNPTMAIWLGKVWLGQKDTSFIDSQAPKQGDIDKDHIIMMIKNENEQLKNENEKLKTNGHKPQTK